jgi:hypothetical protein
MSVTIELRIADVEALRLGATGLETLRALAGPQARALGQDRTDDYAFLAVKAAPDVIREFLFFPSQRAVVEYDIGAVTWKLVGTGKVQALTPELHLIQSGERQTPGKIVSEELAGFRLGEWAILFYTEAHMAQTAVSFDVEGPPKMKFLIAGLAPGAWEIWRAGMRELEDGTVAPSSGVLFFEGKPGSYFLRNV